MAVRRSQRNTTKEGPEPSAESPKAGNTRGIKKEVKSKRARPQSNAVIQGNQAAPAPKSTRPRKEPLGRSAVQPSPAPTATLREKRRRAPLRNIPIPSPTHVGDVAPIIAPEISPQTQRSSGKDSADEFFFEGSRVIEEPRSVQVANTSFQSHHYSPVIAKYSPSLESSSLPPSSPPVRESLSPVWAHWNESEVPPIDVKGKGRQVSPVNSPDVNSNAENEPPGPQPPKLRLSAHVPHSDHIDSLDMSSDPFGFFAAEKKIRIRTRRLGKQRAELSSLEYLGSGSGSARQGRLSIQANEDKHSASGSAASSNRPAFATPAPKRVFSHSALRPTTPSSPLSSPPITSPLPPIKRPRRARSPSPSRSESDASDASDRSKRARRGYQEEDEDDLATDALLALMPKRNPSRKRKSAAAGKATAKVSAKATTRGKTEPKEKKVTSKKKKADAPAPRRSRRGNQGRQEEEEEEEEHEEFDLNVGASEDSDAGQRVKAKGKGKSKAELDTGVTHWRDIDSHKLEEEAVLF